MKTYVATPANRQRDWYVVDAEGRTLGRLATQIADALRGKRKPEYTPHCDTGDFVVVVNAAKIQVTGNKLNDKLYHRHSGYPGGLRSRTLGEMLERRPEEVIRKAVKGMLPRNRLARQQLRQAEGLRRPGAPARGAEADSRWRSRPDGGRRAPRRRAAARGARRPRRPRRRRGAARRGAAAPRRPQLRPDDGDAEAAAGRGARRGAGEEAIRGGAELRPREPPEEVEAARKAEGLRFRGQESSRAPSSSRSRSSPSAS